MENLSHSRHPNRSKKACGNAAAKSLYDDVYGGPPKSAEARTNLSPRVEDYGEIFGSFQASRASSIPVLDLPAVDESEVFFDVRSSGFDYTEVFGGFEGLDFALSYEDLLDQAKTGRGNSSDEAWSPVEFESMSDESDTSGKDQYHTNGSPQQKFDGSTEFSISYHQAQQLGAEDVSNGMTHVAHLHAVPGFSYMVDSSVQQREAKATDNVNLDMDFSADMTKAKHLKKTMSHPPNGSVAGHAFENDARPQKGYGEDGSSHGSSFVGISEISLRTQPSDLPPPSRPPPAAEGKKEDSSKLVSQRNALAFGGMKGDCSPPFFDVEVDASSSAAVSAAAMKEAMEKAQAKLKSAKELMEKKKEGLQSSYKLSKKSTKEKAGETGKVIDGSNRLKDERVNSTFAREDGGMSVITKEKKKASKTAFDGPEILDGEELCSPFENNAKEKPEKESWSSGGPYKIDEASEWKEATEFFELVTTDEPKIGFEQANSQKIVVQNLQIHEREQRANEAMESFEKQSGNSRKVKTATEDYKLKEYEKKEKDELFGLKESNAKSKEEKKAFELKGRERQSKVTREVYESEENKTSSMAKQLVETNKNLYEAEKLVKARESKSKTKKAAKQKDNEQKMMGTDKVDEIEKQLKLFHENVDKEGRQKWAFDQDKSQNRYKEAGKEAIPEKAVEQEKNASWLKEILEKVESDRQPKEVVTQQDNEKGLKRPLEQGKSKKKEKEKEKQKEVVNLERQDKARDREEAEKRLESVSRDREIRKKIPEREDSKGRSKSGPDKEETKVEQLDIQNMSMEALEQEEAKQALRNAVDSSVMERLNKGHKRIESDKNSIELRVDEGNYVHDEAEDFHQSDKAHELDCSNNTQLAQLACNIDESCGDAGTNQEAVSHEEIQDAKAETISNEVQAGIFGRESEYVDINLEVSSFAEEYQLKLDDAKEAIPINFGVKNTNDYIKIKAEVGEKESAAFEMETMLADEITKTVEKSQETLYDQVKKTGEVGSVVGGLHAEKVKGCSTVGSDSRKKEREFAHDWEEKEEECPQAQASLNQEEKMESATPAQSMKESMEDGRKKEATQLPRAEEKQIYVEVEDERMKNARQMENERIRKVEEEREKDKKQKNQKSVQQVSASQALDRKEKIFGEVEDERMKKAREMEKEIIVKVEEERERDEKQKNPQLQQGSANQTTERKEKKSGGVEAERVKREREMENERARKIEEERQINQKAVHQINTSQNTERRDKTSGEVEMERMRREREMENERLKKIEEEKKKNQKSAQQSNANLITERREKTSGEVESERMRREREIENERLRKIEEEKQKNQKSAQQINVSHITERREKTTGEVESERMRREWEMENERLRKLEEEREREREREKDRMAVDLATLETRERVFGESRQRAERTAVERATAEARQRAMAEARERLEKACAEAREKSLAGKTAMDARIKAERAAVERATAEARERAAVERATAEARERAERAMVERAAYEARERVQRSVSDKFSASSRNSGMRQSSSSSDLQDLQNSGAQRYQYSSVYSERYEVVEGESAQRCKARLERHRRTAERGAKALAEKNMRDLLAQREQAERSRLAETLDADVRRWSSGKEGNLRALLSTLQYILGPDSGWQPIPLTEVITSAAVKKAYRKATLCVHPDKLQQRGASIQQKYVCEKVFDLLKEAWNKFNSEER